MFLIAVIGIDDMATGATASAIISWMIVGSRERKKRVKEPGLSQSQKDRIGAQQRGEASITQLGIRPAGLVFVLGVSYFFSLSAAALEDSQHIAGLGNLPAFQGFQVGKNSFFPCIFRTRPRP